jgi:hypothetical protein
MRQSAFDLFLLYGIGLLGVIMRRFDFPTAPVVVGMILGPLAEAQMRNAVSIGEGSWWIFLQRPMSLTLIIIVLAVLIIPRVLKRLSQAKQPGRQAPPESGFLACCGCFTHGARCIHIPCSVSWTGDFFMEAGWHCVDALAGGLC